MTEEPPKPQEHPHPGMTEDTKNMGSPPADLRRFAATFIVIFFLLAGVTVLIVWLIYRPHNPEFNVVAAAVYDINTTSPTMISVTMQFTILVRNSNRRTTMYYDRLSVYITYKNQQITPAVELPPLWLDTKNTIGLSPIIGGAFVPVSLEVVNGLLMEQAYGVVGLRLVMMGRVRYKAGSIKTKHYGLYVKCEVMVGLKKGFVGQVPLLASSGCSVDI